MSKSIYLLGHRLNVLCPLCVFIADSKKLDFGCLLSKKSKVPRF